MEARELRIGNLVCKLYIDYDDNKNEIITREIEVVDEIRLTEYKYYEPICLTKEWLLKFEFEKTGNKYHIGELEEMPFIIHNENGLFYYNDSYPEIQIKYVHKLQNICYELTSEELTIKETA